MVYVVLEGRARWQSKVTEKAFSSIMHRRLGNRWRVRFLVGDRLPIHRCTAENDQLMRPCERVFVPAQNRLDIS